MKKKDRRNRTRITRIKRIHADKKEIRMTGKMEKNDRGFLSDITAPYGWIFVEIEGSFFQLEEYFEEIEKQIEVLKGNAKKIISKSLKNITDEEEYFAQLSAENLIHYETFENNFPKMFSYSFVIMLYSAVETNFNKFAKHLKEQGKCNLDLKDFNGSLSEKVKNFYKAFDLIGITEEDKMHLSEFSKIRNKIVHTDGIIENDQKIKNLINIKKELSELNQHIVVDNKYCYDKLKYFQKMFTRLFEELRN